MAHNMQRHLTGNLTGFTKQLKDANCQASLDKKIKVTAPYPTCVRIHRRARLVLRKKIQVFLRFRRPLRLM